MQTPNLSQTNLHYGHPQSQGYQPFGQRIQSKGPETYALAGNKIPPESAADIVTSPARGLNSIHTALRNEKNYLIRGCTLEIEWDGSSTTFPKFKSKLEGWYQQNYYGFMVTPSFVRRYYQVGPKIVDEPQYFPGALWLTRALLAAASNHMYGLIQGCPQGIFSVDKYVRRFRDTQEGLVLWQELLDNQDC